MRKLKRRYKARVRNRKSSITTRPYRRRGTWYASRGRSSLAFDHVWRKAVRAGYGRGEMFGRG